MLRVNSLRLAWKICVELMSPACAFQCETMLCVVYKTVAGFPILLNDSDVLKTIALPMASQKPVSKDFSRALLTQRRLASPFRTCVSMRQAVNLWYQSTLT